MEDGDSCHAHGSFIPLLISTEQLIAAYPQYDTNSSLPPPLFSVFYQGFLVLWLSPSHFVTRNEEYFLSPVLRPPYGVMPLYAAPPTKIK